MITEGEVAHSKNGHRRKTVTEAPPTTQSSLAESRRHRLLRRIAAREARIGVIGLGYVGLPLATAFAETGFDVIGIDLSPTRVDTINAGRSYIGDIPSDRIARLVHKGAAEMNGNGHHNGNGRQGHRGSLRASSDYDELLEIDAVIVCVPTPLTTDHRPDVSYIVAVADELAVRLPSGALAVLESTTYPGTTEELLLPRLTAGGIKTPGAEERLVGFDFFLAFSPERIDPGRFDWDVRTTPKVVGGVTPACLEVASALYRCAVDTVVPVSTTRVAETVKLLENTFRALNIGLANEMAIICDHLGIDVWEVIDAAKTKPFGFMPFYPGPGLGGHCIPIDPQYLSWKLRLVNYHARFIQLAEEVNGAMPDYVVAKIADALNDDARSLRGARILIIGMAYKANVGDARESPSLDIAGKLIDKGARVSYHDPHVGEVSIGGARLSSIALDEDVLRASDCVLITTAHDACDWQLVVRHGRLVVDTRNVTRNLPSPMARVVRL